MLWSSVIFVGVAIVLATVEARWPARGRRWWQRDLRTDLAYWVFTPIVSHALVAAVVAGCLVAVAVAHGVPADVASVHAFVARDTWAGALPLGVQIVAVVVVGDLLGYLAHVALHHARLWRFHAIHHAATELDWLASSRLHPIDDIVLRATQLVPLVLAGFDVAVLTGYLPFLGVVAVYQHANVPWTFGPLRYVIASPVFHAWHHTSEVAGRDKNFAALFPVWDLAFGTFYLPARALPHRLGVDEAIPDGLFAQLAWPFRRR
ncbi:MAG TPA: sterol desaturase family protein [Kofleriaceae bacterium]|nr:sterol desaturase family protein [Kofleriaceae bacterium]